MVEGDIVICPLHGWEFDLRSGACMTVPGESVPQFTVTVEEAPSISRRHREHAATRQRPAEHKATRRARSAASS